MNIRHGTTTGYVKGKCRCELCKEAKRKYDREYRQRPEVKKRANERQKRFHAKKIVTDPAYREWRRAISRKSAAKMRADPESWERTKARSRKHSRKIRDLIQEIKLERGCVDCGYREHPEALEFDHIESGKKFRISRSKFHSLESVLAEIEKCEVVCANCHRIRTYNRRQKKGQV